MTHSHVHAQKRKPKREHFRVPAFKTPPKFHEKTPKREKKEIKFCSPTLWAHVSGTPRLGATPFGAPPFGPPPFEPPIRAPTISGFGPPSPPPLHQVCQVFVAAHKTRHTKTNQSIKTRIWAKKLATRPCHFCVSIVWPKSNWPKSKLAKVELAKIEFGESRKKDGRLSEKRHVLHCSEREEPADSGQAHQFVEENLLPGPKRNKRFGCCGVLPISIDWALFIPNSQQK